MPPLRFIERIFCLCRGSGRSESPVQVAECVLDFGPESTDGGQQQHRRSCNRRSTRIVVRRTANSAFVNLSDIDEEDEEPDSNDDYADYVDDVNVAKFYAGAVGDNDPNDDDDDDGSSTLGGSGSGSGNSNSAAHYSMVENARRAVAALAATAVSADAPPASPPPPPLPRRNPVTAKRVAILRNGSAMPIRYGYMDDIRIEVQNTCAFDTLVQMFACATVDSEPFGDRMLRGDRPPGLFVQLIRSLLKVGATSATYDLRARILYSAFPHDPAFKSSADTFARISCDYHVKAMADKVLTGDLPTGLERRYCSDPACPRPSKTVPVASVPYSYGTGGFDRDFPESVDGLIRPVRSVCAQNGCQAEWTIEITLADHMLVEVQNIPSGTDNPSTAVIITLVRAPRVYTSNSHRVVYPAAYIL